MRPIRLRMSVRVLMVLVLLVGAVLGWNVHNAKIQRDAVTAIEHGGGSVRYDWDVKYVASRPNPYQVIPNGKPWWPKWLVDRLGPDYFGDVKAMQLGPKDSDAVMASVGQLRRLGALYLTYRGTKVTDAGLAHLRGLNQLEALISYSPRITGAGLAMLKDLKQLRELHLTGARDLSDPDLAHLKNLTALESLALRSPRITDTGLVSLSGLVKMRYLDLMFTRVTAAGLAQLRPMTRLESLALDGTLVDDLSPIRHLTRLRILDVSQTPMTDGGLAGLEGCSELSYLDLSGTKVTDAGLGRLRGLKKLRTLRVRGTAVSNEAVAALRKELPLLAPEPAPRPPAPRRLPSRPKAAAESTS